MPVRPKWRVPVVALLLGLALLPAGCERWWGDGAGGRAGDARPFPERVQLAGVIAATRAILPRVPATVPLPPLGPPVTEGDTPEIATRLALVGEGSLLQPQAHVGHPAQLAVALHLDDARPPGGHARVSIPRAPDAMANWPILDSFLEGDPDGEFALSLRLVDATGRLRYLVVLGVPYRLDGAGYRALEGYLLEGREAVTPRGPPGSAREARGAVYPIDFGYRHPHPPRPVLEAQAWAERVAGLRAAYEKLLARREELAGLEQTARDLGNMSVPPEQAAQKRQDLASLEARAQALGVRLAEEADALRARLKALHRQRARLSESWNAYTRTNAYRWRDAAGRKAVYAALEALRPVYPVLEQVYAAVTGAGTPSQPAELDAARAAMEQALLSEAVPVE